MINQGNALLRSAHLENARFELVRPPSPGEPFRDSEVSLIIPEKSLADAFTRETVKQAGQQGAKVSECTLSLASAGPNAVRFDATISASMFVASLNASLRGRVSTLEPDALRFDQIQLETGSGMLGGMAKAFLEPHIRTLASAEPRLGSLAGRPVRWTRFEYENGVIEGRLSFEG